MPILLLNGDLDLRGEALSVLPLDARPVVAADGGMRHAQALALEVDSYLGDGDSQQDLSSLKVGGKCVHYPVAKDFTDGYAALSYVSREFGGQGDSLSILGAWSWDRPDHSLQNVLMCFEFLSAWPKGIVLTDGLSLFWPWRGPMSLELPRLPIDPTYYSLLALSDLKDCSWEGVCYRLEHEDLPRYSSRPLSNEALPEGTIRFHCQSGEGLVILSCDRRY